MNKFLRVLFIWFFIASVGGYTEATDTSEISGVIEEVADDGSYIVIGGTKIGTTRDFLDGAYLEKGDNVKIFTEQTDQGMQVMDYEYIFDDVSWEYGDEYDTGLNPEDTEEVYPEEESPEY